MVFLSGKSSLEKIKLAKESEEKLVQIELINSCDVNVRKALTKNPYLDTLAANILAFDPSLNVSYHASKHRNCTYKREFSLENLENKCVLCEKDELTLNCDTCCS